MTGLRLFFAANFFFFSPWNNEPSRQSYPDNSMVEIRVSPTPQFCADSSRASVVLIHGIIIYREAIEKELGVSIVCEA